MVYKKIIFLIWIPISSREAEWFNFALIEQNGFSVQVFDLTALLHRPGTLSNVLGHSVDEKYIHRIHSYDELSSAVKENQPDSLFIDWIMGIGDIRPDTSAVFRILKRFHADYSLLHLDAYPILASTSGKALLRIKKVFNLPLLVQFLARKCIAVLRRYHLLYSLPKLIFANLTPQLEGFLKAYHLSKEHVIPLNYIDYDTWVQYPKQGRHRQLTATLPAKYCVFLDDAQTHHPDVILASLAPLDVEKYHKSMRTFFDKVERETGMEVLIAAHPRPNYEGYFDKFGNRKIIQGKTIDLVANSSMVLMHFSASVSFAILFDKPIMIVTNDELIRTGIVGLNEPIARALHKKTWNIDDPVDMQQIDFDYSTWDKSEYPNYIKKYLRFRQDDLTIMEVITKTLKARSEVEQKSVAPEGMDDERRG